MEVDKTKGEYNAYVNKHGIELMACNDKMQRYETATKHATNELQRNSEKLATDLKTCNAKLKDIKEISEKRILQNETLNKDINEKMRKISELESRVAIMVDPMTHDKELREKVGIIKTLELRLESTRVANENHLQEHLRTIQELTSENKELIRTLETCKTNVEEQIRDCLLYTSDAADERSSVDLGGRRIIKKKKKKKLIAI